MRKVATDTELRTAFDACKAVSAGYFVTGYDIQAELAKQSISIDPSTIRGRFIQMGLPLRKQKTWGSAAKPVSVFTAANIGAQTQVQPAQEQVMADAKPTKKTKYTDGQTLWVLKDVAVAGKDMPPGISKEVEAFAGKRVTVAFTDNNGFVHINENPNIMFNDAWFGTKPDITPIVTRPLPKSGAAGYTFPKELEALIPNKKDFADYVERPVDKVLAMHYTLGKHPITQGPQGTGKTRGHAYYAMTEQRPLLLLSMYEDFKLPKLFGDKTIQGGSITFQESLFTRAIQHPSVILFDEINAVSQANTFDFHALLQNRCLFIKDADNGNGKMYTLHPDCKIGFSQNPKSAKYIGGQVRASNFLGRCTYITYPQFGKAELGKAVKMRYPELPADEAKLFIEYFNACCEAIEKASINVDISIRQLFNAIDFNIHGMDLPMALESGITAIADAVSNPKSKAALNELSKFVWKERFEAGKTS